ncbi:MAG TPA: hypothetical protein VFL31_02920, partial [Nitrospiraceae bacterium]|nr:hypothetical protein [Nitrospiraceae bacterium]
MMVQHRDPQTSDQTSTRRAQPDPSRSSHDVDPRSSEDRHLTTAELMIGTAMMFTGFLSVLMSISGGFEISVFPIILYFAGLAIWAHATIVNPTVRYTVVIMAIVLGLAFFHYGEVYFWHKQVIFWTTVAI